MTVPYWPVTLPQSPVPGLTIESQNVNATFQVDIGKPIDRSRATGVPFVCEPTWVLKGDQIATFETFFLTDVRNGTLQFVMRHPNSEDVRFVRFLGGTFSQTFVKRGLARVQAQLMILPSLPWFADYVPDDVARVPDFVADYANGVFGIKGLKTPAASLEQIAGSYLVETASGTTTQTRNTTLSAGDVPATAPAGITSMIGFAL